jgi:hypothetical protein
VKAGAALVVGLVGLAGFVAGCRADKGTPFAGRWQGGSRPPSEPISIAFTLRAYGDSLRGWGVARTDGGSFPIAVHGAVGRSDTGATVILWLSPWRAGVVDINSAQVYGTLRTTGIIKGVARTDAGLGIDFGTPIELRRP